MKIHHQTQVEWYPGFDHVGIATQTVVEKKLHKETGRLRREFTDAEFIAECERWKSQRILDISAQLEAMGPMLDWSRSFYTMDEVL